MKVVYISSMLPSGHFSQYVTSGLNKVKDLDLIVYTDKSKKNLKIKGCGKIKPVWSKSPVYIGQIFVNLLKDNPDVVHVQQELNMYGGILTAALFPFLLLIIKFLDIKVVTTLHASVYKDQIDYNFVKLFQQNPKVIKPFF